MCTQRDRTRLSSRAHDRGDCFSTIRLQKRAMICFLISGKKKTMRVIHCMSQFPNYAVVDSSIYSVHFTLRRSSRMCLDFLCFSGLRCLRQCRKFISLSPMHLRDSRLLKEVRTTFAGWNITHLYITARVSHIDIPVKWLTTIFWSLISAHLTIR
jgi:hypothetical protein